MKMKELIGKTLTEEVIKEIRKYESKGYVVVVVAGRVYAIEKEQD